MSQKTCLQKLVPQLHVHLEGNGDLRWRKWAISAFFCRNGPFFVGEVRPLDRTALRGRRRAELVPPPRPVRFPVHPER